MSNVTRQLIPATMLLACCCAFAGSITVSDSRSIPIRWSAPLVHVTGNGTIVVPSQPVEFIRRDFGAKLDVPTPPMVRPIQTPAKPAAFKVTKQAMIGGKATTLYRIRVGSKAIYVQKDEVVTIKNGEYKVLGAKEDRVYVRSLKSGKTYRLDP